MNILRTYYVTIMELNTQQISSSLHSFKKPVMEMLNH